MITLENINRINSETIIVDGFWGSGKNILFTILPAFENILRAKFLAELEWILILRNFEQIDKAGAIAFLNTTLDNSVYSSSIGRETNLRWSDNSGLKYSENKIRDIALLFSKEGESVVEEINRRNTAQCLWTHNISLCNNSMKEVLDQNIYFLKMIRHPIFIIETYKNFLMRFNSSKVFTPSYIKESNKLPWFTFNYREQIDISNYLVTAILLITNSYETYFDIRNEYKNYLKFGEICFEELIFNPNNAVSKIKNFLGRDLNSRKLIRILKKNKIPRKNIINGIKSGTERLNNLSDNSKIHESDQEYCYFKIKNLENKIPKDLFIRFKDVVNKYQEIYPFFKFKY